MFGKVYESLDDAKLRQHAALLNDDFTAAFDAEFDWASAEIELAELEADVALHWMIGLRCALKRYPVETAELLDKVFAVRRMMWRK